MPGLGEEFRAAREARHLALSDVSDQIHIRSIYLQSIEEEDWSAIAAPVYVRGFIRTYARFLGLDPEASVEAYNADLDADEREAAGPMRVAPTRRGGPSIWIWLAGAAALILLVFVGYSYYQLQSGGSASSQVGDAAAASPSPADASATGAASTATAPSSSGGAGNPAAEQPSDGSPEPSASSGSASPALSAAALPATPKKGTHPSTAALKAGESTGTAAADAGSTKVALHAEEAGPSATATADPGDLVATPGPSPLATHAPASGLSVLIVDRAWVRVDVDGKAVLEGIYPAGTRKSFSGKSAYIRTGNAGGVVLVVNGKNLGKMGPGGEIVEKTFTLSEE